MNISSLIKEYAFYQCLAGVLLFAGCERSEPADKVAVVRPVKIFVVGEAANMSYRTYPAKVRSGQRVKLAFQVSGQLQKFPVKSGQSVRRGELLGELDPRDYENALKSATARYNESKSEFERYGKLVEKKAASAATFDEKRKIFEVAEAELKIAEKALADTQLLAPFDGVVASTYVDNFQNIQSKQEILSLQGNRDIELVINVPEKDIIKMPAEESLEKVTAGLCPIAIFPALKDLTFALEIKEFETEAEASTQTYQCVLTMPAPKEYSIFSGMTALVRVKNISIRGENTGVLIPVTAVGRDAAGNCFVWVINDRSVAVKRPVTVGGIDGDRIGVTAGLRQGETIAAAGVSYISEGLKVKPLDHLGNREMKTVSGGDK